MTATIMKQDSNIHLANDWKQLITYAKNLGLSKEDILEFLKK
jgi:DNA-binding transcriptional regulator YhcF (GntR family)